MPDGKGKERWFNRRKLKRVGLEAAEGRLKEGPLARLPPARTKGRR